MSDRLLAQARAGDQDAFRELVGPYGRDLQAHCYRILGSVQDAEPLQYQGPAAIASFLRHQAASRGPGRVRLVPTRANTQPAFGVYLHDEHAALAHAATLLVLTLQGGKISALTCFLDTSVLPHFGLPRTLPD